MKLLVFFIALDLLIWFSTSQSLECQVNVSTGVPWSVGKSTFNFADLQVTTQRGLQTPQYTADIDSTGNITSANAWNLATKTVSGFWESLYIDNPVKFGAVFSQAGGNDPYISTVALDGSTCDLATGQTIEPVGTTEAGLSFVSVQNGQLIGNDGQPLSLKGINWFGFEEPGNSMVDGLWFGTDSISKDFATIVYRLQLLGFNAVRLPMNFKNLYTLTPSDVNQACNIDSQRTIADSTKDPSSSANAGNAPSPTFPVTQTPGQCNG